MARMEYVDIDSANDRVKELLDKLEHKNIFSMLAHSPSHLKLMSAWKRHSV